MPTIQVVLAVIPVVAVAVTAVVTWLIAQRQITATYVTGERAKWRETIRKQALVAHAAILREDTTTIGRLQSRFRALLNPFDQHDRAILDCLTVGLSRQDPEKQANEFARRISLLLKHDWERAKLESGFFLCRWTLDARRLPLGWDDGEGSELRISRGLLWCEKYKVKWLQTLAILVVAVVLAIAVVGVVPCLYMSLLSLMSQCWGTVAL